MEIIKLIQLIIKINNLVKQKLQFNNDLNNPNYALPSYVVI